MGANTSIEWCDHTFNPWVGCAKVSAGCAHCYAEADTPARVSAGRGLPLWGTTAARQGKSEGGWTEPVRWFRAAVRAGVRRRVFCASQGDVFEDRRDLDEYRSRLWDLIETTAGDDRHGGIFAVGPPRGLDWLLLTKRPENILRLFPERWRGGLPPNVWVGTSVENQEAADERIPHLLRVPARVRFLSIEPLLGPVDLSDHVSAMCDRRWPGCLCDNEFAPCEVCDAKGPPPALDWLILGGESGPHARPCDLAWIRDLRDQGRAAGVPVFIKQLGSHVITTTPGDRGQNIVERLDEVGARIIGQGWRVRLRHPKGGDPAEWPKDLRVREFPGELHGEHCPGAACALPPDVCRRVHRPIVAAPRSVGPGTPEEQARMRGCERNHTHSTLMLGRVCACGYEGRA